MEINPPLSSPAKAVEFIPLLQKEGSYFLYTIRSSFPIASDDPPKAERGMRREGGTSRYPDIYREGRDGRDDNMQHQSLFIPLILQQTNTSTNKKNKPHQTHHRHRPWHRRRAGHYAGAGL